MGKRSQKSEHPIQFEPKWWSEPIVKTRNGVTCCAKFWTNPSWIQEMVISNCQSSEDEFVFPPLLLDGIPKDCESQWTFGVTRIQPSSIMCQVGVCQRDGKRLRRKTKAWTVESVILKINLLKLFMCFKMEMLGYFWSFYRVYSFLFKCYDFYFCVLK